MATNDNNQGDAPATSVNDIRKIVETAKTEDENLDDDAGDDDDGGDDADDDNSGDDAGSDAGSDDDSGDDDGDDADSDDDDSDDDDAKDKPGAKKDPKSRRFTQFAGDGSEEAYLSNLEKGYENSSKEAIRLNQELSTATSRVEAIMRAAQSDPDLATKLNAAINAGGSNDDGNSNAGAADNPFVRNLQSEWQEKSEKEIETFIEANPEVATDPQISKDVKHWMNVFSTDAYERTGKLMTGGEAMALAYKHLGLENKLGAQALADGAKKTASPTRSRGKSKKSNSSKTTYTADQLAFAKSMGKDQEWLEKNAK